MTLKEMLAKVALGVPLTQERLQNTRYTETAVITPPDESRFFSAYEDSVNELLLEFPAEYVFDKTKGTEITGDVPDRAWSADGYYYEVPDELSDPNVVRPLFNTAILHNIQFLCGLRQDFDKTEFVRLARSAYNTYWSEDAKGRRLKRLRW